MLYISLLYATDVWMKLNLQLRQVLRKYCQKYFDIFKYHTKYYLKVFKSI